jgi:hypothetical protein
VNDAVNGQGYRRVSVVAAKAIGVDVEEYERQLASGNAWCSRHKGWAPRGDFRVSGFGRRDRYCNACRERMTGRGRRTATAATT